VSQEHLTGFIVEVRPKVGYRSIQFGQSTTTAITIENPFLGYFFQMTDRTDDGNFHRAHMTQIELVDIEKKLYRTLGEVTFKIEEIDISVRANRGPIQPLPGFEMYEIWNRA
jgi:hypothetical protein